MSHPRTSHSLSKATGVIALVAVVVGSLAFAFANDSGSSTLGPAAGTSATFLGNATSATYVYAGTPSTNYNGVSPLDASHVSYRTLLQFATDIPADATVTSAALTMTPDTTGDGTYSVRAEPAFSASTVTWSNQPTFSSAILGRSTEPTARTAQTIDLNGLTQTGTIGLAVDFSTPGLIAKLFGMAGPAPSLSVTYSSATPPTTVPTTTPTTTPPTTTPPTTTPPTTTPTTQPSTGGHKLMVIMEENQGIAASTSQMPYLTSLGTTYGNATHYAAITHPSLPNYLAIFGGSVYGTSSDCSVGCGPTASTARSVWDETIAAGKSAKAYQQSMTKNCATGGQGSYAPRHGPWAYWTNATSRANCAADDVPTTALQGDITAGHLPITGEITPDLQNDWHDGSAAQADAFLKTWVPALMAGPDYKAGNLTIVITFDENGGSSGNVVQFVVVNPTLSHVSVTGTYNHYSLSRWFSDNAGVAPINNAATAADIGTAFGL